MPENTNEPMENDGWDVQPAFVTEVPSLEGQVERGDSSERGHNPFSVAFSIKRCPELIKSTVTVLTRRHSNLSTGTSVSRYATRCGLNVLLEMPEIRTLGRGLREAYETGNDYDRLRLLSWSYDTEQRISLLKQQWSCSVFSWVHASLVSIADSLGLTRPIVAQIMLCAGFSKSEHWVPERHRITFANEVSHFQEKMQERIGVLGL